MKAKAVFKTYDQSQLSLLPPSYDDLIPANHPVRIVIRLLYSSRKIEQALQENIHFMWLSGQSNPDHNTINDFRGKRLKGKFKNIFNQVVLLLQTREYYR